MTDLRGIPSVDKLLHHQEIQPLVKRYGHSQVVFTVQGVLENVRQEAASGKQVDLSEDSIIRLVSSRLVSRMTPSLVKVINASGVILHTNLGRAPLCRSALDAIHETAAGYSNLEYELGRGARGSRSVHARDYLCQLTGAEDALVVNNNAGAVLLALSGLARRKRVVISRSQLVEIGGGFRIPDVMKQSGARLVEVGTTNRVHIQDYEDALSEGAALVMRAHTSNFKLIGFTSQPELEQLVRIAHRFNAPLLDDLGSGALLDTARFGLAHEPMVQESLQAGADLVCFSADKLLGGPQAGIILGKGDLITKLKRHPLARAIRADKLCLAALAATLQHYLVGDAENQIPVWRMIGMNTELIRERANKWQTALEFGEVIPQQSTVGGGSLPEETLPTYVLSLVVPRVDQFAARLRAATPAIICRIQDGTAQFDPRTVQLDEDDLFINTLKSIIAGAGYEI